MSHISEEQSRETRKGSNWGILGAAALLGLAAATLIVVNRTRQSGKSWSFDDLIDAADRAADNLERTLMRDHAHAS